MNDHLMMMIDEQQFKLVDHKDQKEEVNQTQANLDARANILFQSIGV